MKFVCIDVDGTLVDFTGGIRNYLEDRGISFNPDAMTSYSFKGDIGCPRSEVFKAINNDDLYPYLEPYKDIDVPLLMLGCYGVETKAYTGSVNTPKAIKFKENFLKKYKLDTGDIYFGDKPVILSADALFDDNLSVHRLWIESGYTGKLFLINHNYNSEKNNPDFPYFDRITRCEDFYEAVEKYLSCSC